jgi:hypothetical protein
VCVCVCVCELARARAARVCLSAHSDRVVDANTTGRSRLGQQNCWAPAPAL